jgi:hypothetical protein
LTQRSKKEKEKTGGEGLGRARQKNRQKTGGEGPGARTQTRAHISLTFPHSQKKKHGRLLITIGTRCASATQQKGLRLFALCFFFWLRVSLTDFACCLVW